MPTCYWYVQVMDYICNTQLLQLDCYVAKLPRQSPRKKKKVNYYSSPRIQHDISVEEGSSQTKPQVTEKTRSTSPTNNLSYKSTPSTSTDVDSIIWSTILRSEDHKEQMLDMKKQ